MTPEQIALKAYRERSARLEAVCEAAGAPLYEKSGFCPSAGYKPSISRRARVYVGADDQVLVERLEVRQFFRRRSCSTIVKEATCIVEGRALADAFIEDLPD